MIKGITVTLHRREQTGTDPFGNPIWTEAEPEAVEDVLVAPTTADEAAEALELWGRRAEYMLYIPKGDSHTWKGSRVSFFGQDFLVISPPEEWIAENVPGRWNRRYRAAIYV